jgi:hypothetical protein
MEECNEVGMVGDEGSRDPGPREKKGRSDHQLVQVQLKSWGPVRILTERLWYW